MLELLSIDLIQALIDNTWNQMKANVCTVLHVLFSIVFTNSLYPPLSKYDLMELYCKYVLYTLYGYINIQKSVH